MSTTSSQSLSSALTVISAISCQSFHAMRFVQGTALSLSGGPRKARLRIPGMTLVVERPHDKYGSANFITDDLKVNSISVTAANHIEVITVELPHASYIMSISRQASSLHTLHWDTEAYPRL